MVNLRLAVLPLALVACDPELADGTSVIASPRLIAVRADPAEAAPGDVVSLHALYVSPDGEVVAPPLDWAACLARKPFTEPGAIAPACLVPEGDGLEPLGEGGAVEATIADDACRRWGPDPPDPEPGAPAGRPADPDGTGGYYEPVRVRDVDAEAYALAQVRVACGLPGATQAQLAAYQARHRPNADPVIASLSIDGEAADPQRAVAVPTGTAVALTLRWPACDDDDASCGGAEGYVYFDPGPRAVIVRHEAMRASWFVTAGSLADAHAGRAEDDPDASVANTWIAPDEAGPAWLWVVLRDDRGGATWTTQRVDVTE